VSKELSAIVLLGRSALRCPRCQKSTLVEIHMKIAEREVTFRRCGRCEAQTWETADGPLPLGHVIDMARVK
jgi:ribosomal protein S27AE